MRYLVLLPILLLVNVTLAQKSKPDSPYYKIALCASKSVYSLGDSIGIMVVYYNGSDSSWLLYRPDSSLFSTINYQHKLWRQETWCGYAFKKNVFINYDPSCPECEYDSPKVGGKITIKPKDTFVFRTDIMEGYPPYDLLPGQLKVYADDGFEAIISDTINICVKFTPESVDFILKRIVEERRNGSIITWALDVLSDIYPDIKNYSFSWNYDVSIVSYSEHQKEDNEKLLSAFRAFWEQNRETDAMKACIYKINTDLSKYYPLMDMRRAAQQDNSCIEYPKKKQKGIKVR